MSASLTHKPGSAAAFNPLNKLSSNTDRMKSLRSGPFHAPDAHVTKKRKTEPSAEAGEAHFEPRFDDISDATSDRKSTPELAGSQEGSPWSSSNLHQGCISEFNNSEDARKRGRRKRKGQTTPSKVAEDVLDSDQDELARDDVSNQFGLGGARPLTRTPRAREHLKFAGEGRGTSVLDGADDQFRRQVTKPSKPAGTVARAVHAHHVDHSPDPLHSDPFNMTRHVESIQKSSSPGISTRGDIRPALPKARPKTNAVAAVSIRVKSAVCVPDHVYPSEEEDPDNFVYVLVSDNDKTSLIVQSVGDGQGDNYRWVELDSCKIERVYYDLNSRFLKIIRSNNIRQKAGPVLMVECVDEKAAVLLVSWLQARVKGLIEVPTSADKLRAMWMNLKTQVTIKRQANNAVKAQSKFMASYKAAEELWDNQPGPKETNAPQSLPSSTRRMVTRAWDRHSIVKSPTPPPNVSCKRWSQQAENKGWDDNWHMPLHFKRTTVDKDDIPKLDEGEFLNDNLISFCISYVQDKYKAALGDRVFFHNSFFYEKLKMPGRHNINYDGVRGWTSKVDILSKDYIVVPVNEHHHWWVAIICHPGRLERTESQSSAKGKNQQAPSLPGDAVALEKTPDAPTSAQAIDVDMADVDSRRSSSSPDGATAAGMRSLSIDSSAGTSQAQGSELSMARDKGAVNDLSSDPLAAEESPNERASLKRRSTGRRYDPDVPRIITLDSLGAPHSAACTHLKKYLVAEFSDKRGVEITDLPMHFGMTATNIPQQDNFCDCGVYLIGYIMEFARHPDAFINGILEKKHEWPLKAPDLRAEIRQLILKLQEEYQEGQIAEKKRRAAQKERRAKISKSNSCTPKAGESPNGTGEKPYDTPAGPSSSAPSAVPSRLTSRDGSPAKHASALVVRDEEHAQAAKPSDEPDTAEAGRQVRHDETSSAVPADHRRPTKTTYDARMRVRMSADVSEIFRTRDSGRSAREMGQDRRLLPPATVSEQLQSPSLAASSLGEVSIQHSRPASTSRKLSSASASSRAEIEEQLKPEAFRAPEKVNGNPKPPYFGTETFQDPAFVEKLPDSSPTGLPREPPTGASRRSQQTSQLIVDIASLSSKEASHRGFCRFGGEQDNPVILDDADETKPPAALSRAGKRNSTSKQEDDGDEVVELPATPKLPLSTKTGATPRTGGDDASWSSGSRNFLPAGHSKVSRPSPATQSSHKSPASRPGKSATGRLALRHSSPATPIDLTEDD